VPLEPEFIVPQDGHDKQDCESWAAGWSATSGGRARHVRLGPKFPLMDMAYKGWLFLGSGVMDV